MRALLCTRHGEPELLELSEVPLPQPGPGQVRIAVQAAGVNFPDTLIIRNLYQFKPALPFSPGGEVAGVITALGDDAGGGAGARPGAGSSGLREGDRVMALCGHGGFAEQVIVDAAKAVKIPEGVSTELAASFTMVYATSYHALVDRAALRSGESLLVLGAAGGVGLSAVEIGKALGARVIAAASSDAKLQVCREHGADDLINYTREDLRERLRSLTAGQGVDVVYDPVGGTLPSPPSGRSPGAAATWSSVSPSGRFPRCRSTSRFSRGQASSACSGGPTSAANPRPFRPTCSACLRGSPRGVCGRGFRRATASRKRRRPSAH